MVLENSKHTLLKVRTATIQSSSRYKFCIAIENSLATDYVTEKIYDSLAAGCLPIYYGAPNIRCALSGHHHTIIAAFHSRRVAQHCMHYSHYKSRASGL